MSPCGRYIAVGAADAEKTIQIIDLDIMGVYTKIRYAHSSKLRLNFTSNHEFANYEIEAVSIVRFHPKGDLIVSTSIDCSLRIYSLGPGKDVFFKKKVSEGIFSPPTFF